MTVQFWSKELVHLSFMVVPLALIYIMEPKPIVEMPHFRYPTDERLRQLDIYKSYYCVRDLAPYNITLALMFPSPCVNKVQRHQFQFLNQLQTGSPRNILTSRSSTNHERLTMPFYSAVGLFCCSSRYFIFL